LCSTCTELDFHLILRNGIPRESAISLGPLTGIIQRAGQCGFCRLASIVIRRTWLLDEHPHVDLSEIQCSLYSMDCGCLQDPAPAPKELCHRFYIQPSDRPREIYDAMLAANTGLMLDIQLLEEDACNNERTEELHGRRVGDTIDIGLVKKWLDLCEREHGDVCESVWWRGSDKNLPKGVRMLDVTCMSIVHAPPGCRYVALSYLWGGMGAEYWTTQANLKQRGVSGGLDMSSLPGTITDSIQLVRQLGERYLWVDALCIIQDNLKDKAVQIGVMELIYGSSLFTIFAAGGRTANSPLPGLRPGTRRQQQHIDVIQGLHLTVPLPMLRETLTRTAWDTRGWTFQEVMLSRRRLFFTDQQIYFECGQDVWCEDVVAERKRQPRSYQPLRYNGVGGLTFLRTPPSWAKNEYLSSYASAVGLYTQRQLTMESDIVNAITALTNAWTKGFKLNGGDPRKAFRFGMSITDLHTVLLWQPEANVKHYRRSNGGMGSAPWPSWSWAGWRGAVHYAGSGQYLEIHKNTESPRLLESLVDPWFIVDEGGEVVQLEVGRMNRATAYPEEIGPRQYLPPQGIFDPLQLGLTNEHPPEPGTLIFRTSSAWFDIAQVNSVSSNIETHYAFFSILSNIPSPSTRVGRIILPLSIRSPASLKFIVLSRTNGPSGVYDENVLGERYSGCFLYVMAVEKKGDTTIMERVGVGIIFEGAWL
ncbi:hypothetical protein SERLA73DRAFT_39921, partial [Serpula lacrymans var. lacrymans S7.3]